ncbi:MAG: hypothetical protein FJ151_04760 [Euryarchaeota archaeon]|nr:hypothetical protein [Euryarchaeota archaeon]
MLWNHEQAEAGELFCSDWDFDHLDMFCDSRVPSPRFDLPEEIELTEAVRHSGSRPVSLVELLDAFDEARKEAEARMKRSALREAMRNAGIVFDEKSHPEDLEQDVEVVWERIQRCGPGAMRIEDIYNGNKEDRVMVFVSLLFLAKMGKIALMQDDFPYGQILLEVRVPWDIGTLEDAVQAEIPAVKREMVM